VAEQRRVDIDWVQASAGALAATSSAVLLSTVGVAGTVIGAAVGSVVATLGNAVYARFLIVSRERVVSARITAREGAIRDLLRRRRGQTATSEARDDADVRPPRDEGDVRPQVPASSKSAPAWRESLGLPWRRIAVVSVVVFLLAMAVIVAFELLAGRTVSSITGGSDGPGPRTSIPGMGGSGPADERSTPTKSPTSTPTDTGSSTPSETSTPSEGTEPTSEEATEPTTTPSTASSTTPPPTTTPPATTAPVG